MPQREEKSPKETRYSKVDLEENESAKIPLTRCPPKISSDGESSIASQPAPVATKPATEPDKPASIAVGNETLSTRSEPREDEIETPAETSCSDGFVGSLLPLGISTILFVGLILALANQRTPSETAKHASSSQASTNFADRDDQPESRIASQNRPKIEIDSLPPSTLDRTDQITVTPLSTLDRTEYITLDGSPPSARDRTDQITLEGTSQITIENKRQEILRAEPIKPQVLFAQKLLRARSEYDSAIEKLGQVKGISLSEAHSEVNYQYIQTLESKQSALRPGTGLYKAYSKEIALARQYAFKPPYVIDFAALARANRASRLSPDRKAYSAKAKTIGSSGMNTSAREKEAAVKLILEAREVIAEIREHYADEDGVHRALQEEFRLLKQSIPKESANFKTLRTTIQSLENQLLDTRPDGSTDTVATGHADPPVGAYLLSPKTPPPHGFQIDRSERREYSPIMISTLQDANFLVKLVNRANNRYEVGIFIEGPCEYSTFVPSGTYEIQVARGATWFGEKELFGPNTVFLRFWRERQFAEGHKYWLDLDSASDQSALAKDEFMNLE